MKNTNATNWEETPEGFVDYVLPSYWASYLINGDASGIDFCEQEECDAFLIKEKLVNCVDVSGDTFFSRTNDASTLGSECANYRFVNPA